MKWALNRKFTHPPTPVLYCTHPPTHTHRSPFIWASTRGLFKTCCCGLAVDLRDAAAEGHIVGFTTQHWRHSITHECSESTILRAPHIIRRKQQLLDAHSRRVLQ